MDAEGLQFTFEYPEKFHNGKDLMYLTGVANETSIDFASVGVDSESKIYVVCENAQINGATLINKNGYLTSLKERKRRETEANDGGKCRPFEGQIVQDISCDDEECQNTCQKMFCKVPVLPMKSYVKVKFQFNIV